jgi:proteic killer suppression protein
MIVSYGDRRTRLLAEGRRVNAFSGFARQAEIRLDRLDAAKNLGDLAALAGNKLEALRGDRKGQYSIRINDQWRICFAWPRVRRARPTSRLWTIIRRTTCPAPPFILANI